MILSLYFNSINSRLVPRIELSSVQWLLEDLLFASLTMSNLSPPPSPAPEQNRTDTSTGEGPIAQFGRFVGGRLTLKKARTTELEYVAISHVWGKIEWISDKPNVDGEVKASRSKATFIEKKLPGLVGEKFFWMDTLTVNQRNQAEVLAIVQIIPTIFRDAVRTIAIREGGEYTSAAQTQ